MRLLSALIWLLHDRDQQDVRRGVARRPERGEPAAGGDDRGERGPAAATGRPGARGRSPRRAAADGAGDPRHARAGTHRDSHPAAGGRAGRSGPGDPAGWRRHVGGGDPAGAGQPDRGAPVGGRAAPRAAGERAAERGAGLRRRALVGPERDPGAAHDHRRGAAGAVGGRVRAAARRTGGARERGQARARHAGSG